MGTEGELKCVHCNAPIAVEGQSGCCPQCGQPIVVACPFGGAFACPTDGMEAGQPAGPRAGDGRANREAFNVVTDTVIGPNVRLKDNFYQALAIGICLLLGAGTGALVALSFSPDDRGMAAAGGAIAGGILGLIVGVIASGLFLGIYRLIRHIRGHHD